MKTLQLFLVFVLLTLSSNAAVLHWDQPRGEIFYEFKIWKRNPDATYTLLGTSKSLSFNLGQITEPTSVCVSTVSAFYNYLGNGIKYYPGIEGPKSAIMVVSPAEQEPYTYVSVKAEREFIFAVNGAADKRFFRFDVNEGQATFQDSSNLLNWRSLTNVNIGSGEPKVRIYK